MLSSFWMNKKAEQINKLVDDHENNIDEVMSKIDQIETKIKFQAFGKKNLSPEIYLKVLNQRKHKMKKMLILNKEKQRRLKNTLKKLKQRIMEELAMFLG